MDVPIRQVQTEWGTFHATAVDSGTVRFKTRSPNEQDPDHYLTLNRLWYSADVELSVGQPKRLGRHYVDDVWHTDLDDCSHRLRRHPVGGEATLKADLILSERVLPELAAWLHTDDGRALLGEGSVYRQARETEQAASAVRVLESALDRLVRVQALLDDGVDVDPKDQRLVHHINDDLDRLVQREAEPFAHTAPGTATDRPVDRPARRPEPPGL